MKNPRVSFRAIDGSGPLSITWFNVPLGDAVEDKNHIGVGFFAHNGDLLSVEFDDVNEKKDHQVLEFDRYRVELEVSKGKISYSMTRIGASRKVARSTKKRDKDAA